MNILLIENDQILIRETEKILINNRFSVITKSTIRDAIFSINPYNKIDLIISEIHFSDKTVFNLFNFIKKTGKSQNIPVIITSNVDDHTSILKCIEAGASEYIVKPYTEEVLMTKIEKVINLLGKTVLIVDDDEIIQNLLQKTFEREGYRTIVSSNGVEALSEIEKENNNIKLVVSDIEMPQMNGMELLKNIKESYPKIPVLMISGKRDKNNKQDILEAGADGFITKPFKNTEVLISIKSVIG